MNRKYSIKLNSIGKYNYSKVKENIIVIGAGWAGYRVAMDLDKSKYNVKVISPRNHFLFTPLLPSTAVGTLEFRAIQEPVRTIPNIQYHQATVNYIDFDHKSIECIDFFNTEHKFSIPYDGLVIAPGSDSNTFGVKGVINNPDVFFLKQLDHSRKIRNHLIENFEKASIPDTPIEEIKRLLSFVVVGGGPTSIEFAAELYDFIKSDVSRWFPDLFQYTHITVVEASGHILGSFNESLVSYVENLFIKRNVELITGTAVSEIKETKCILNNGKSIDFGLMVWSTGVKQTKLINDISDSKIEKLRNGRLVVNDYLQVIDKATDKPVNNGSVFALGDCAGNKTKPLPLLAQVASQQGIHLAKELNKHGLTGNVKVFSYNHLGSMANIGQWKGVFDSANIDVNATGTDITGPPIKGFAAFLLWRAAYWTKQVSLTNKMLILMYWFKSAVFGRDISRF